MDRVVLDANVLVSALSGFRRSNSVTVRIFQHLREAEGAVIVISGHIASEVGRALSSPYFRDRMSSDERMWSYEVIRKPPFVWIEPHLVQGIASHSEDDVVIGTAIAGRATCVVTSDRQLLKLEERDGIAFVSPPDFLAMIQVGR